MLPNYLLPYHAVDTTNPIFQKDLRHLRWLTTPSSLNRYTRWVILGIPALVMVAWSVEAFYLNPGLQIYRFERVILLLVFAAVGVMGLSSLFSIPVVIGTFTAHLTSPYWDMLRLTPQSAGAILTSEDAIAQIRLWPLTALEIGLRISLILWVITTQFYRMYVTMGDLSAFLAEVLHPFVWGFWIMLALFSLTLFLEPIIRTRLIVALHIAIAARLQQVLLGGLASLFAVVLVHAAEVLLAVIAVQIMASLARHPIELFIIICITPLALMMLGVSLLLYRLVRTSTFSFAHNHAFQQD